MLWSSLKGSTRQDASENEIFRREQVINHIESFAVRPEALPDDHPEEPLGPQQVAQPGMHQQDVQQGTIW